MAGVSIFGGRMQGAVTNRSLLGAPIRALNNGAPVWRAQNVAVLLSSSRGQPRQQRSENPAELSAPRLPIIFIATRLGIDASIVQD